MRAHNFQVRRSRIAGLVLVACLFVTGLAAIASRNANADELIDRPAPLPSRVKLSVAAVKQGHIAVMQNVPAMLAGLNVEIEIASFVRFADARTALTTGSADVATVGPGDLAIALAQGVDSVSIVAGIGSSNRYVVERDGVDLKDWADLKGRRLGIPNGSATWMQFAAKLEEVGQPYSSFEAVNIQGGGPNFVQALKNGEVDAIIIWEPFESQPAADGFGRFAKKLDYSDSKAIGSELGVIAATSQAMTEKKEALRRFLWAYMACEKQLRDDRARFARAIADYTGIDSIAADRMSQRIKLGGVLTLDQLEAQSAWMFKSGIIPKDVVGQVGSHYDTSLLASLRR
ncbi:MAG: ABC transporter substrate-binding protein [Bradyrhizobium sp.]